MHNCWHSCFCQGGQQHSVGWQIAAIPAGEWGIKSSDGQAHGHFKATFHRAGCSAGVTGERVESQQATLHGKRGAAVEAAQWGFVQPQEVSHVFRYPLPVAKEFWLLPQPQRVTQMTLSESGEDCLKAFLQVCRTDPNRGHGSKSYVS